jgi:predicted sulfurtransferase
VNAYLKQKLGYNNLYRLRDGIISYENWVDGSNQSNELNETSPRENRTEITRFKGVNYVFDGRRSEIL